LSKLAEVVLGPDFPPPAASSWAGRAFRITSSNGRGSIKVRGLGQDRGHGARIGRPSWFQELPYQVNKARLIEYAAGPGKRKRNSKAIGEIRDESDRDGMRIVFELKRGEQAEVHPEQSVQANADGR